MTSSFGSLPVGYRIGGRYELMAPIASGGMAQVWRGLDTVLDRPVAVKVLHPHLATDHAFLVRFRREAVAAARLSHRSIVGIFDTVSEDDVEAIVMELIEGQTLREVLDDVGALSASDANDVGLQVAEALAEAHAGGVVHRDIKPSNILLCTDRRVMVTDFGIAKAGEDTDLTVTGTLLGTAKYLAPEQVRGEEVDPRTDLYALGVVLFEAISGRPPFQSDTDAATALARLHEDPPTLSSQRPDTPEHLNAAVNRLLQRDPSARYQRAIDVRAALSDTRFFAAKAPQPAATQSYRDSDPTTSLPSDDFTSVDGADDDPPDDGFVRSERSWLIPAFVVLLLAGALLIAGLLITQADIVSPSGNNDQASGTPGDGSSETTQLTNIDEFVETNIATITSFDPQGDGSENQELVANAYDDDEDTTWRSEIYKRPDFARLKDGVGLLIALQGRSLVDEVEFSTRSTGWTVEIYVGDDFSGSPSSWGSPVATATDEGDAEVDLDFDEVAGSMVLFWVTNHGVSVPRPESDLGPLFFELEEVTVS